jgi:hypothetical protein
MLRNLLLLFPAILLPLLPAPATLAQSAGRIAGTVADTTGTPQMGATISILPEQLADSSPAHVFTDARGRFLSAPLAAGLYTVNVTLAGFLPALAQHVDVDQMRTTVLHMQMGTALASLERSAAQSPPGSTQDADNWKWVLRGASASRPILRWSDAGAVADGEEDAPEKNGRQPRAELAISAGTYQPGSLTNFADAPTTGFAYDMNLGAAGRLVMAGAFSYLDQVPAGGFDTLWVQGNPQTGQTITGVVLRQSELGPNGLSFRGMRLTRQSQIAITDRLKLNYGGEVVLADLDGFTSSLRPDIELTMQVAPEWRASFIMATQQPYADGGTASSDAASDPSLQTALTSLNAFPVLLERDNRPVLQGGWHEEVSVERGVGRSGDLVAAAFHDQTADSAVFGEGVLSGPNVLPDYFSNGFAYDAGSSGSWGLRAFYRQKIGNDAEASFLYSWAGVLAPAVPFTTTSGDLSGLLATRYHHSLGARFSAKVPHSATKVTAGYVWVSGSAVARLDPYGQSLYGFDPFLSIGIHQPMPAFFPGHMMLVADVSNLLAQGYVPVTTKDGQILLIPTYRTFQGGVSFQF